MGESDFAADWDCPADWTDIVTLIQITAKAKMNDIQKDRFEIFSIILLHSSTK
jgi:hypothetical protein